MQLSRLGVFDEILAALAEKCDNLTKLMIDATHLRAHCTAGTLLKKGACCNDPSDHFAALPDTSCAPKVDWTRSFMLFAKAHSSCCLTKGRWVISLAQLWCWLPYPRPKSCSATKIMMSTGFAMRWQHAKWPPAFPQNLIGKCKSRMTRGFIGNATRSKSFSAGLKIGDVFTTVAFDGRTLSCLLRTSQQPSFSGSINESWS